MALKNLALAALAFSLGGFGTVVQAEEVYRQDTVTEDTYTTHTVTPDATVSAPQPRTVAAPVRVAPVLGTSSFANDKNLRTDRFGDGFSAGVLADFGESDWNFETGVLTLSSNTNRSGNTASVSINTWGIPLLAKLNFSGKPHETVFLKAGVMPFLASGQDVNNFNVLGVGGLGANIPLGRNTSILLDATYNRLFNQSGDLTNYQGIALLAGLSFNI